MIASMTGYGFASIEGDAFKATVELRSVNHRFFEWNCRLPRPLSFLEEELKKIAKNAVQRGKLDVFIKIEGEALTKRELEVDWDLLKQYEAASRKIAQTINQEHVLDIPSLLFSDQLVQVNEAGEVDEELIQVIKQAMEKAVHDLRHMRMEEGSHLKQDLDVRLNIMSELVEQIDTYSPEVVDHYRDKLRKRVNEFLSGFESQLDESRLLAEVALFAEKSDISEELTRLRSHIEQFANILSGGGVVGRKLDFLVQEMNREANTIGSKANHLAIRRHVVEMKSEIEKMKEQVQNIE
ncbi:YicC family protein [Halalkalibacterium halodurans]|jgi:uncharacterized protein (TIGR00255 family)|uniref:BH2514 protein n=2 Tax=Halalkalibacterium halodurans TaxID=86665 RepID=Q9K9Y0_HALH5|nr:YicC/YloC family endoribonuclease [Halalkalibacterium halodurans]MDY7223060.1 YicC/YloC family endoribonuclease [Halalkalibacterium halodurans]MDY7242281.1 YicC/YloC family endoribonuclease [Halalkalibacterium halodurans]MED3647020.1 YicC family protein [Halalkalibacterium halodurans]MED4081491.1 YicC family protein [Halalkalibacterium halodurans]MED4086107.1 YicC family protein [Halalkalibacterium halodurans]